MNRKTAVTVAALAACFVFGGCRAVLPSFGEPGPRGTQFLTIVQSGQLVDLKEGQRITAVLPAPDPARRWALVRRPDETILKAIDCAGAKQPSRATGEAEACFEAGKPGYTSFRLEYLPTGRGAPMELPLSQSAFELTVGVSY